LAVERAASGRISGDKADYVREMFAGIAHRYDLLNSLLSFSRHRAWRRQAVRLARLRPGDSALDVCTGTGDFALDLRAAVGASGLVAGADFCEPMVRIGQRKAAGLRTAIHFALGDALRLPYRSGAFHAVTVGFGIRNVADVQAAFAEMARVARPGGRVICLEFSEPEHWFWRPLVRFYEHKVLPRVGALLSRAEAYRYLPDSISEFDGREALARKMEAAGLRDIAIHSLNFGSVCIHVGVKP
jgi:demethylmenaquinone methyltransferase/2-methoxy-6-polyprenyl-1,4-benzoquinol methylase